MLQVVCQLGYLATRNAVGLVDSVLDLQFSQRWSGVMEIPTPPFVKGFEWGSPGE